MQVRHGLWQLLHRVPFLKRRSGQVPMQVELYRALGDKQEVQFKGKNEQVGQLMSQALQVLSVVLAKVPEGQALSEKQLPL